VRSRRHPPSTPTRLSKRTIASVFTSSAGSGRWSASSAPRLASLPSWTSPPTLSRYARPWPTRWSASPETSFRRAKCFAPDICCGWSRRGSCARPPPRQLSPTPISRGDRSWHIPQRARSVRVRHHRRHHARWRGRTLRHDRQCVLLGEPRSTARPRLHRSRGVHA